MVKIKQMSVAYGITTFRAFGLGDDNKVYYWDYETGKWELDAQDDD